MRRFIIAIVGMCACGLFASVVSAQTLTWTYPPGAVATGFTVWRAPGSATPPVTCDPTKFVQIASLGMVYTYKDTDAILKPGTSWCYEVQAFNALATSAYSNVATYITPLPAPTLSVTVAISGAGAGGTVVSTPAGISCTAGTCSHQFPLGSAVVLVERPKSNTLFVNWTGPCAGSATACGVVMTESVAAGAAFRKR